MPPGVISPSWMLNSGTRPAIGWRLSCIEMTAPVDVPVVMEANSADTPAPKRTSLPSRLPSAWSTPAGNSPLPAASRCIAKTAPPTSTIAMAAKIAQPWRRSPAYRPKVNVSANGTASIRIISTRLVRGVGFSNGWAEFALRKPPPLLPNSLMTSWEAIGPRAMFWVAPWRVVATAGAFSVWGMPCHTKKSARTMETGSRT